MIVGMYPHQHNFYSSKCMIEPRCQMVHGKPTLSLVTSPLPLISPSSNPIVLKIRSWTYCCVYYFSVSLSAHRCPSYHPHLSMCNRSPGVKEIVISRCHSKPLGSGQMNSMSNNTRASLESRKSTPCQEPPRSHPVTFQATH